MPLVLSRKAGETIVFTVPGTHETIRVTVTEIRGDKARLGIDAPKTIRVDREEVYLARAEAVNTEDRHSE